MKHLLRIGLLMVALALPISDGGEALAQAAKQSTELNETEKPQGYVLSAAYPNPFNPRTSFSLKVEETQPVRVEVYNLLGLPVKQLFNGTMDAGETRTFTFDAGDLPSGIYLYRIQGKNFTATRQMTLLK